MEIYVFFRADYLYQALTREVRGQAKIHQLVILINILLLSVRLNA